MKQIELTVQVFDDYDTITDKLINLGFKRKEKVSMHDMYFSKLSTEQLKNSSYEEIIKNSFLIRQIDGIFYLLYKNKSFDEKGNLIGEEKVSVKLSSFENTKKIFELSNMTCWCELKQNMFVYKKGPIEFIVQLADDLGIFIEYEEDETVAKLSLEQKIETMKKVIIDLGLNINNDFFCKKPYMQFLKNNK